MEKSLSSKPAGTERGQRARRNGAAPRSPLDRNDWIDAALGVLAEQGVSGLRVEVLAKHCGVTKGSFYWHFKDRRDLLDAVLQAWKEGRLRDIDKQATAIAGQALDQIHHLIEVYSAVKNRKGISIELAVRDWARHDAAVAAAVEAVDAYRLERTRTLFLACGLSDDEARARSILVFAYVFGHSLMAYGRDDPKVPEFRRWIAGHIAGQ